MRFVCTACAVLVLAVSSPAHAAPCGGFTDVDDANPAHAPFCDSVEWMKNRGITLGCASPPNPPNSYCPNENVTRLQMAAFMYRLGYQNTFLQGGNAFGATAVLGTTDNHALDIRVNGARTMRYEPSPISPNVIGGSSANSVTAGVRGATIGGGGVPIGDTDPDLFQEAPNRVTDVYGTVGGGFDNQAGDGLGSIIDRSWATVAGGRSNTASGLYSTVGGGVNNTASGAGSFAAAANNEASGIFAIAMGYENLARGDYSVALGNRAKNLGDGSFQFADSSPFDYATSGTNNFRVRATGGVRFTTGIDGTGATTWSCVTTDGTGWSCSSDRNLKQNLLELDGQDVLAKVAAMRVYQWQPKGKNAHVKHYGPMAQDFHAAFGLGDDETMVGMQDADGVALAAIQGLNAKVEHRLAAKDAEIATLRAELAEIRALLARGLYPKPDDAGGR